jgi:hypothetical protein
MTNSNSHGLISIVGRTDEVELKTAPAAAPHVETEDRGFIAYEVFDF